MLPRTLRTSRAIQAAVEFAEQNKSATATNDGTFQLELDAIKADATKTFTDVLVGEDWLCSGQSHLQ